MDDQMPSFFERIALALKLFFRILRNPECAARIRKLDSGATPWKVIVKEPPFKESPPGAAIQLLGLLQQEGRFIDFLEEDVAGFSDTEIGAAARVVHQGCRKAVRDHFKIIAVRAEPEGSRITLPEGFDASSVRLTGNVVGNPPYNGSLIHRGWRVSEANLPKVAAGHDVRILASAEVEL